MQVPGGGFLQPKTPSCMNENHAANKSTPINPIAETRFLRYGVRPSSTLEAGINNVRSVLTNWLDSEAVPCDLAITRNVTYFVGPIARFVAIGQRSERGAGFVRPLY